MMQIPIPFLGWLTIDEEDTEQMLRDQIHIQQRRILELEAELMKKEKKDD
jgi:hemolysin-activating ACP:hemolysin acyltransferase